MVITDWQTNVHKLAAKSEKNSVLILCEELRYTDEDKHVIDTALALINYGHKVVIIANKNNLQKDCKKIKRKLEVVIIGKFIPKSIFGYFHNPLQKCWSVYAAVFTSVFRRNGNANVIFCDKNIYAIPILNVLGSYKIIQFHNLYGFNQLQNNEVEKIKFSKSWLDLRSIKFANEVLLPNKVSRHLFEEHCNMLPVTKTILYPCICTDYSTRSRQHTPIPKRYLLPNIPVDSVIFVIFGEYVPRSNLELAIHALAILTRKVRKHNVTKIQLVIAGGYNKDIKEQYKYCSYLMYLTKKYNLSNNVTLLNSVHPITKKSLLECSIAMIQTTKADIYDRNILEAMSLSKPVIASCSDFTMEVLEHGITGYILPPEPIRFAEIMHEIIYNHTISNLVGQAAYDEYLNKYSFQRFARDINSLVMKYTKSQVENKNRFTRNRLRSYTIQRDDIVEEYLDTNFVVSSPDSFSKITECVMNKKSHRQRIEYHGYLEP